MDSVPMVWVLGGRVFFEVVPIPGNADYEAGYEAGLHNAQVELTKQGAWAEVPKAASDQWGMGHRDGFQAGLRS